MKIGLVRQRFTAVGGAERYVSRLAEALVDQGHEVHLFARSWQPVNLAGLRFHRVRSVSVTSLLRQVSFALASRRAVREAGCDLVFSFERTLGQDVYRAGDGCHREWLAQRRCYLPLWRRATLAVSPFHRAMLALERRVYSPACTGRVIANSRRGRDEILRHYGFPEARIHVVYNGVDTQRFQPRPRPSDPGRQVLLFVGTGFERKGLGFCLEALPHLPSTVELRVVGKGPFARYRQRAAALGVASRLHHLGARSDLTTLYPEAEVLVHPAIYEPFANVCLEALACGVPVVTSRVNGASEILTPGVDGAVVERPEDARALAQAIAAFLPAERRVVTAAAARQTAERHAFEGHVHQTLAILLEALEERRRVAPASS